MLKTLFLGIFFAGLFVGILAQATGPARKPALAPLPPPSHELQELMKEHQKKQEPILVLRA